MLQHPPITCSEINLIMNHFSLFSSIDFVNVSPQRHPYSPHAKLIAHMATEAAVAVLRIKRKRTDDPLKLLLSDVEPNKKRRVWELSRTADSNGIPIPLSTEDVQMEDSSLFGRSVGGQDARRTPSTSRTRSRRCNCPTSRPRQTSQWTRGRRSRSS